MSRSFTIVVAIFTLLAMAVPVQATPRGGTGTVLMQADVPDGAAALIEIRSTNRQELIRSVVVDGDDDVAVELSAGTYSLLPRQLTHAGQRFVAEAAPASVQVRRGQETTFSADYTPSLGVQDLRVTGITDTSVALDWDAERGDDTTVWRVEGTEAPTRTGQGTEVTLTDMSSLTDEGLAPGTTYSYSIFARPGDGAFGRDDVDPVSITVNTEGGDPMIPVFALNPAASILPAKDFTPFSTGESLILRLSEGVATPAPGTVLLVQAMAELPGGYIGVVSDLSADGQLVELLPASMADAFDLYQLEVDNLASLPEPQFPPAAPPTAEFGSFGTASAAATKPLCGAISESVQVKPSFTQDHDGYANVTIDTYNIKYLPDVPYAVEYDFGYETTVNASVDITGTAAIACKLPLQRFGKNLTVFPIPIALDVNPSAEVTVNAAGTVENLGGSVTAGFKTDGRLGLDGSADVGGALILDALVNEPTYIGEPGLGLKVGGALRFGPGAASNNVGVIVGVKGSFSPLDASAAVVTTSETTDLCLRLQAATTTGLAASLGAWVPGYSTDFSVTIDQLQGSFDWPGSPYFYPSDCTDTGPDDPTDDVVGDGVTVIKSETVGASKQFGKVSGLVPGEDTWVLSTGDIADVVGSPSDFASTNLGQPGDPMLTQLSGNPTFDAAAYQATLVPDGETLVVRYVFASEEYPEFVGSQFNDVMAVFVDGTNCAFVPGTTTAVAINTINHLVNSEYYIDNTTGASGYGTAMDGLTVPLECRVTVTPGEEVVVRIAVADASDAIYDSAVALLDGGIFSE